MVQRNPQIYRRPEQPRRPRKATPRETPLPSRFLNEQILDGPPSYSRRDFEEPRLRKCRFNVADIDWEASKQLAGGLDGYSWKIFINEAGPYVLKMFWDLEQPKHYFAPERECQNAAILAMIEASVAQTVADSAKIYLDPNPKTEKDARANFYSFAKESVLPQPQSQNIQDFSISRVPRFRKCHGWLKIGGQDSPIPSSLWPPTLNVGRTQRLIVTVPDLIRESTSAIFA
ncbi:hypothetical protein FSARC_5064 [Fusarium sarcochroum]|uniref:Uncharacterized protein n=1 Tax=Fusarium sarcochroum TaxID=1208366 RepID=A0A8H4XAM9_9HYPO|nr:hypothetical protein FSARC_5064 [Fusarium sarcochroum]